MAEIAPSSTTSWASTQTITEKNPLLPLPIPLPPELPPELQKKRRRRRSRGRDIPDRATTNIF
jgi:hypothetical protein